MLSIGMGYAARGRKSETIIGTIKEAEERMYRQKLLEGSSYRNSIIGAMLSALEARSMETEAHAGRIRTYCVAIGMEIGLSQRELDELALLAVLHDIGKIGINESILKKPGPLTDEEWEEMRKHPEIGHRIAANTPDLAAIAPYILSHHERWDGSGYPLGIKKEEIPLLCRIMAVADAFDAMTNDRPYRKAFSTKKAVEEIRINAGKQFDPKVVKIFLRLIDKRCLLSRQV